MELKFIHKDGTLFGRATGRIAKGFFTQMIGDPNMFRFGTKKMKADNKQGFEDVPTFFPTDYCKIGWGIESTDAFELWIAPDDYVLVKR